MIDERAGGERGGGARWEAEGRPSAIGAPEPFRQSFLGAFVFPFGRNAIASWILAALVLRALALASVPGMLAGQLLLWSFALLIARDTDRGADDVHLPSPRDAVRAVALVLIAALPLWAPAIALPGSFVGFVFVPAARGASALPLVGLAYLPLGLLLGAREPRFARAVNPAAVAAFAMSLGGDLALALAMVVVLGVSYVILSFFGLGLSFVPWIGPFLQWLLLAYPFLALGRLLGLLLRAHPVDP